MSISATSTVIDATGVSSALTAARTVSAIAAFCASVRPGMMLRMPVEVTAARHGVFKFRGEVFADGVRAVQAEFSAKAVEH